MKTPFVQAPHATTAMSSSNGVITHINTASEAGSPSSASSACIKDFLLDMCTQLKKAALRLLWDLTPDTLKMAYIWLLTTWYGTAKMASYNSQVLLLLLFCPAILFWRHTHTMLPLLAGSNITIPIHSSCA